MYMVEATFEATEEVTQDRVLPVLATAPHLQRSTTNKGPIEATYLTNMDADVEVEE